MIHQALPEHDGTAAGMPRKTYNVTDKGTQCCCIATVGCCTGFLCFVPGIMGTKTLTLGRNNMVLDYECTCCKSKSEVPYGDLGGVETQQCCGCQGISGLGTGSSKDMVLCPAWGCEAAMVAEIVNEIKMRAGERGGQGQLAVAEETLAEVKVLRAELAEVKLCMTAIMEHHRIQPPAKMGLMTR